MGSQGLLRGFRRKYSWCRNLAAIILAAWEEIVLYL